MENTPRFERETCSRCSGSGNYSFNQIDGTRCFKCMGKKEVLTKRARIACERMRESLKVEAKTLKSGDVLNYSGARMTIVKTHMEGEWLILTGKKMIIQTKPSSRLQKLAKADDIVAAVEYQNTLTKSGKPYRRK